MVSLRYSAIFRFGLQMANSVSFDYAYPKPTKDICTEESVWVCLQYSILLKVERSYYIDLG